LVDSVNSPPVEAKPGAKPYTYWADLIRVVAIYLVVMIHVSGQLTNAWGKIPVDQWVIADIYGAVARISVPLFFMISGYLLLPRSESLRIFFTKRMVKILIPFVVWSLIYLFWFCGDYANKCTANLVSQLLLVKGTYYHLWFLYTLISIYLILPVLHLMFRPGTDKKILWYLIGLWLVFQPILTIAKQAWNFNINISPPLATGFLCFFVLGSLLGEMPLSRPIVFSAATLWIIGTFATVEGTYLLTLSSGVYNGVFYDFVSMNVIIASVGAFILLRRIAEAGVFTSPRVQAVTRSLASASFGIYLVHILVMEILNDRIPVFHLNSFIGYSLWSVPLVTTIVFLVSFLLVRGLQKIPVIKLIVP
jgi:surface polysaccharide O-acyltransferase-like enzyme